jgi:hypothetical protein
MKPLAPTLLCLALLAAPLAGGAQERGKMPRVGVLVAESAPHPFTEAFRSGMRDLGYVDGRNIAIEWRYADASLAERSSSQPSSSGSPSFRS